MQVNTDIEIVRPAIKLALQDEKYLFCLHRCQIVKKTLLLIYKKFIPIELLPQTEKLELWNYIKPKAKSQEEAILMCKIIYTVSQLYENVPNVAH